jgi:TolC family type I secretion outer membrane protein
MPICLRSCAVHLLSGALLTAAVNFPVAADPQSDLFQPDAFRTGKALEKRTPGLTDPQGRDCPLPSGGLSLPAAVGLALCRNPSTRSAWAAARQQAAALGSAESAWLPSISGTASESRNLGGDHVDATGNIVPGPQDTKDAAVTLTWTLYDFGGRGAHIRSARSVLDAAAGTLNSTSQQVVFSVVQAFYGVVAADELLLAAKTTEETADRTVAITRALQTGGVATLSDVLQAETAYDQAILARVQADAAAKTARGTLAVAIGSRADQAWKLESEPVPSEVQPLTARMSDLMAEATRQRPDLAAALAQRDAAEANVTVARAVGRPSISFQGGHELADTTGVPNQNYNQIGLYLTVPLFSGFNVGYGVRQAQAQLAGQEATAEQVRLQVSLDVWNAYYLLDSGNQQLGATSLLTKTAANNQDVALGRYKSGVGTIIDVLTAQTAAANARQLRINAELSWKVARSQLALALGRLTGAQPLTADGVLP